MPEAELSVEFSIDQREHSSMTIEADAYKPEAMESVKRVFNRAIRYQLDAKGQPCQIFEASSRVLRTLSPETLLLPCDFQKRLNALLHNLRRDHWQNDPGAGNEAIRRFYSVLNKEMRRLGLRS
jgi:hypothetical protein